MSGLRAGGTCAHLFSIGPQAGGPVCVGFREHAGLQGPGEGRAPEPHAGSSFPPG